MDRFHNFFVCGLALKKEWRITTEQLKASNAHARKLCSNSGMSDSSSMKSQTTKKTKATAATKNLIPDAKHLIVLPVLTPIDHIVHMPEFKTKLLECSTIYYDPTDVHLIYKAIADAGTISNDNIASDDDDDMETSTSADQKRVGSDVSFRTLEKLIHLKKEYIKCYGDSIYNLIEQELTQYRDWFPLGSKEIRKTLRKYRTRIDVLQTMEKDEQFRRAIIVSERISEKFRSSVILTRYNRLPYNIDTVDFYAHVNDMMMKETSFYKYYTEKYGYEVHDMDQPLLTVVHTHEGASDKKPWEEHGVSPTIYYIQQSYNETYEDLAIRGDEDDETSIANHDIDGDQAMGEEEQEGSTFKAAKQKKSSRPMLIPEFCAFSHLPDCISSYAQYATTVLQHIEEANKHYEKVAELEDRLQYKFSNKLLLRQALTHKSYSSEREVPLTSNERLEFLGDSVLEIIVSHYLFESFKLASEGVLTQYRTNYVRNRFLESVANSLKTVEYLLYPSSQYQLKEEALKVGADTMEALIGAVYLDGGMSKVHALCTSLIIDEARKELSLLPEYEAQKLHSFEIPFEECIQMTPTQESIVELVEQLIDYKFENPYMLLQAITHKSYIDKDVSLPDSNFSFHYERLEFLGDCVLKFVVGTWLFLNYPSASESKMTMARHNTVDNLVSLAGASANLGLSQHFRHTIPPNLFVPNSTLHKNISSDVFEAVLGAIYLDGGGLYLVSSIHNNKREYDVCGGFVHRHLISHRKDIVNPHVILQPLKNKLQEVLQSMLSCAALPSYQQTECIATLDGRPYYNMAAQLSSLRLALGEGTSRKEAEIDAARKAIRLVEAIQSDWMMRGVRDKQPFDKFSTAVNEQIQRDPDLFWTRIEDVKREGLKRFDDYVFEVSPLPTTIESSCNPLEQEDLLKEELLSRLRK